VTFGAHPLVILLVVIYNIVEYNKQTELITQTTVQFKPTLLIMSTPSIIRMQRDGRQCTILVTSRQ